jgi:hypothetical protein
MESTMIGSPFWMTTAVATGCLELNPKHEPEVPAPLNPKQVRIVKIQRVKNKTKGVNTVKRLKR